MDKKSVDEVIAESLVGLEILWYSKTVSYRCYKGCLSLGQITSTKDGEVCQRLQSLLLMRHFREPPNTSDTLTIGNNNNHTLSSQDQEKHCHTHTIEHFGKQICQQK